MKPQNYKSIKSEISGVEVVITTYQIGDKHYCKIQNFDPGATIARAEGYDAEEALRAAMVKASERLPGQ